MRKLIYILFISICLTGCKQCKKTFYKVELSGKVLDEYTGNPIAGVTVYFLGGNTSLSSSGPGYYKKTSTTTDSKGSFLFKFNVNDNDVYALLPEYDKYTYLDANNDRPVEINIKKKLVKEKVTQNLYLKKYSVINVRFKQITLDTILVFSLTANDPNAVFKWTSGTGQYFPAYMADFTAQYIYYGNENGTFRFISRLKSDPNSIYKDTICNIFIPKTEPAYYTINY